VVKSTTDVEVPWHITKSGDLTYQLKQNNQGRFFPSPPLFFNPHIHCH